MSQPAGCSLPFFQPFHTSSNEFCGNLFLIAIVDSNSLPLTHKLVGGCTDFIFNRFLQWKILTRMMCSNHIYGWALRNVWKSNTELYLNPANFTLSERIACWSSWRQFARLVLSNAQPNTRKRLAIGRSEAIQLFQLICGKRSHLDKSSMAINTMRHSQLVSHDYFL